jgi:hypothetical protein
MNKNTRCYHAGRSKCRRAQGTRDLYYAQTMPRHETKPGGTSGRENDSNRPLEGNDEAHRNSKDTGDSAADANLSSGVDFCVSGADRGRNDVHERITALLLGRGPEITLATEHGAVGQTGCVGDGGFPAGIGREHLLGAWRAERFGAEGRKGVQVHDAAFTVGFGVGRVDGLFGALPGNRVDTFGVEFLDGIVDKVRVRSVADDSIDNSTGLIVRRGARSRRLGWGLKDAVAAVILETDRVLPGLHDVENIVGVPHRRVSGRGVEFGLASGSEVGQLGPDQLVGASGGGAQFVECFGEGILALSGI